MIVKAHFYESLPEIEYYISEMNTIIFMQHTYTIMAFKFWTEMCELPVQGVFFGMSSDIIRNDG